MKGEVWKAALAGIVVVALVMAGFMLMSSGRMSSEEETASSPERVTKVVVHHWTGSVWRFEDSSHGVVCWVTSGGGAISCLKK